MSAPPAEASTSTAAQLIDALLAGGQPIDEGRFSLDTAAAAAKLDAFQYADRSGYLIPIAEAARGLDAGRVVVVTRGEELVISIERVTLPDPASFLADPFAQLRGGPTDRSARALGRLGVGLHMALGYGSIERIAVSYSTANEMLVAEYRRDAPARLNRRDPDVAGELRILIDRPWTDRVSLRGASHRELEHLRKAVRHSSLVVKLDEQLLSQQARGLDYAVRARGPGFSCEAGFETAGEEASVIELWSEDVCVETLPGPGLAFRAAVHLEAPRRDLSQMKIVHDETVQAALAAVEASYRSARTTLADDDARWSAAQRPKRWPEARVDRVLKRPVRARQRKPVTIGETIESVGKLAFGWFFYAVGLGAATLGFDKLGQAVSLSSVAPTVVALAVLVVGSGQAAAAVTREPSKRRIIQGTLVAVACLIAIAGAMLR